MEELCNFCYESIDRSDPSSWREVRGWVHGPKQNGLTLSEKVDNFAHDRCVRKAQAGQDPNQEALFEMPEKDEPPVCWSHKPVQHRDGKPPWCPACGRTKDRSIPVSFMSKP